MYLANILLSNPIFLIWLLVITAFTFWQAWNIVNSFRAGRIYNLGRHPLWGFDKAGKWHAVMQEDRKESPSAFELARIVDAVILAVSVLVWLITIGVIFF